MSLALQKDRIIASPLAKRIASQKGIDLKLIKGTGPNGRIVKADVEAAGLAPVAAAPVTTLAPISGTYDAIPNTNSKPKNPCTTFSIVTY